MKIKVLLFVVVLICAITTQPKISFASTAMVCFANGKVLSNVSCNGRCDGAAIANPFGGSGPYTFSWSPAGGSDQTATGLCAGTYTCLVTDAFGCSATASVTITEPNVLQTVIDSVRNAGCRDESSGNIYTSTSGGTTNYTYSWTPSGLPNTPNLIGIAAGTYTLHVTDSNGCSSSAVASVTQPSAVVPLISLSLFQSDLRCFGDSDGSIIINSGLLGGTPPYKYSWSNGSTNNSVNNLYAGQYTVVVYDNNGCSARDTTTLVQPNLLLTTIDSIRNAGCHGELSGSILTTTTGGTPNYTYSWSPSGNNIPDLKGIPAGTYTLLVTDAQGCSSSVTGTILEPDTIVPLINAVLLHTFNVKCFGDSTGIAYLDSVIGGSPPFAYQWSTGSFIDTIGNLTAGAYSLIVYDDNECSIETTITVTQSPPINITMHVTDASCSTCSDGSMHAAVSGGAGGYTYSWSSAGGSLAMAAGLLPGSYTCCVTDVNGCTVCLTDSVSYSTSINKVSEGDAFFVVYPNPFHSSSTVFMNEEIENHNLVLVIFDLLGNEVQKSSITSRQMEIRNLSKGIYLLKIEGAKGVPIKKLIVY